MKQISILINFFLFLTSAAFAQTTPSKNFSQYFRMGTYYTDQTLSCKNLFDDPISINNLNYSYDSQLDRVSIVMDIICFDVPNWANKDSNTPFCAYILETEEIIVSFCSITNIKKIKEGFFSDTYSLTLSYWFTKSEFEKLLANDASLILICPDAKKISNLSDLFDVNNLGFSIVLAPSERDSDNNCTGSTSKWFLSAKKLTS